MAIASDATSTPGASFTGTTSWTHTPVGTPRGVFVQIFNISPSGANEIASVTYGGVALTNVGVPGLYKLTGEPAGIGVFFRGTSLPTGPQTVTVTVSGTTVTKGAACRTFTGAADIEHVAAVYFSSDAVANPTGTLTLGGRVSYCLESFISGHAATTSIAPLANWSGTPSDFGANVVGEYTYNIIGSTDITVGWTQTSEDATGFAFAFGEASGGGGTTVTGVGTSPGLATAAATGRSTVARTWTTVTAVATAAATGRSTVARTWTTVAGLATAVAAGGSIQPAVGTSTAGATLQGISNATATMPSVFTAAGRTVVSGVSPGGTGGGGPITKSMGDLVVPALKAFPAGMSMNARKDSLYATARTAYPAAATASWDDALHQSLDAGGGPPPVERITAITTGQPGTYTPPTAPVPTMAQFNAIIMRPPFVTITPTTPWPVADYVVAAGGEQMTWTGFQWLQKP